MHEQHSGVRVAGDRLGQQRAIHVEMTAWFEDEALAQVVEPLLGPGALVEHGAAFGGGHAVNDKPERLAGSMSIYGFDSMDH